MVLGVLLLLVAIVVAGCGESSTPARAKDEPQAPERILRVVTDPVLGPFLEQAGEHYEAETDTRVDVRQMDGERARARLCNDEADAAGAARPPACTVERLLVAHQALAVVASRELEADCLTTAELGRRRLAGPPPDTSAFDFFAGQVSHGPDEHETVEDENVLAAQLERSESEIAFWNLGDIRWAVPQKAKLVKVDDGGGCVAPSRRAVRSRRYPLSRPLLVYAKADEIRSNRELLRFLRFTLVNHEQFGRAAPTVVPTSVEKAREQLENLSLMTP